MTSWVSFAVGNAASTSPPWALIIARQTSIAEPSRSASAGSLVTPAPVASNISRANVTVSSMTSAGPPPASTSKDSLTSSALPAVRPSGTSIAVKSARVVTPASLPIATMVLASSRACSTVFMKAPEPTLTSSTNAPVPSAIFLLMIEAEISGIDSTVPVTSRRA